MEISLISTINNKTIEGTNEKSTNQEEKQFSE